MTYAFLSCKETRKTYPGKAFPVQWRACVQCTPNNLTVLTPVMNTPINRVYLMAFAKLGSVISVYFHTVGYVLIDCINTCAVHDFRLCAHGAEQNRETNREEYCRNACNFK
jgi:ribosomal protein S26